MLLQVWIECSWDSVDDLTATIARSEPHSDEQAEHILLTKDMALFAIFSLVYENHCVYVMWGVSQKKTIGELAFVCGYMESNYHSLGQAQTKGTSAQTIGYLCLPSISMGFVRAKPPFSMYHHEDKTHSCYSWQ